MVRRKALLSMFFLASLAGCGGGGGGSTATPRIALTWGARARASLVPSSALSVVVRLVGAAPDGSDATLVANRPAGSESLTQTYAFSTPVRQDTFSLVVLAFALPGGQGAIVGRAESRVPVTVDSDLPDVTLVGQVASVEVAPNQRVAVGESRSLTVTAKTASGEILALTEDSYFWRVVSGLDRLTVSNGRLLGLTPGAATVTASVDGIVSPPAAVTVDSSAIVTVTPASVELNIRATQAFSAQVTGTSGGSTNVTWSLAEGASAGSVTPDGIYTAPSTPGIYRLVATSVYDPSRSTTVEIRVVSGNLNVGGTWQDTGGLGVGIR